MSPPPTSQDRIARVDRATRKIRGALPPLLRLGAKAAGPVGAILEALSEIEAVMLLDERPGPGSEPGPRRRARRGTVPKRYFVETVGDQQFLVETRANSHTAFRIPMEVFEAVVKVLASAEEPLPFYEIQEQVGRLIGGELSEYQVRVSIRFLSSPEVGLVQRRRARYGAADYRRFRAKVSNCLRNIGLR